MYSQNNEEETILRLLGERTGFFLDVGAYDGKAFSNTLALVERSWSGVLVEPSPGPFARLCELHGKNRRLKLVNAAVGEKSGMVRLWPSEDGVSTTDEAWYQKWRGTGEFGEPIEVQQISFADLLRGLPSIEFMNIDVEGRSAELLLAFPFEHSRPQVICVEHDGRKADLLNLLSGLNYYPELENDENLILSRDTSRSLMK